MTLQKIEFEYDIPEGYRFVRLGNPNKSDLYLNGYGKVYTAQWDFDDYCIIVEKIPEQPKRKHADLIHAWADGAVIQYQDKRDKSWHDVVNNFPTWGCEEIYRIKPTKKTVRFRNYLKDDCYVGVANIKSNAPGFKEWIGDWQEVEI